MMPVFESKRAAILVLILTQVAVMLLWFSAAAVLPEMAREAELSSTRLAWLTTAVQFGFAAGAVFYAALGLSDRFDPRRVFMVSALVAAGANLALVAVPIGGWAAVCLRALSGAAMAGVYPVGMKIAAGWGRSDRALLISLLVGALTVGSGTSYLIAWFGGADWRHTIWATSLIAGAGGIGILSTGLGPHHARAATLDVTAIALVWTDRRIRLAVLGYIGHMWELFAFWAWVAMVAAGSYGLAGAADPAGLGKLTAFLAIALGGVACVPAGIWAVRRGSARVAMYCLMASGSAALASALLYGGPVWPMMLVLVLWGIAIIPDSALYSTLVADAAPPERAGSVLTMQNALGFLLTALTVQAAPALASLTGWAWVLAIMALGPALGIRAMRLLLRG